MYSYSEISTWLASTLASASKTCSRHHGSGLNLGLGLQDLVSASWFWPWPRPRRLGLGLVVLDSTLALDSKTRSRPRGSGLDLRLGLEDLVSASWFWLDLRLGLEDLVLASWFWPRPLHRPGRLGLVLGLVLASTFALAPKTWSWSRSRGSGLDVCHGLEDLVSASRFWPQPWLRPLRFGLSILASFNIADHL